MVSFVWQYPHQDRVLSECEPHDQRVATVFSASGGGKHRVTSSLGALFEYRVSIFGMKILGLIFIGCTSQRQTFRRYLVEDIVWRFLGLSQG